MSRGWTRPRGPNKYAPYRSKLEADMAKFLSSKSIPFDYETGTIKFVAPIRGGRCNACSSKDVGKLRTYLPDFRVGPIVIETKGRLTSAERTKFIAIKQSNPTVDIRLVFQTDNRIRRNSEIYYSDWAKNNGFQWHVGTRLPAKWVRELKKASKPDKAVPVENQDS